MSEPQASAPPKTKSGLLLIGGALVLLALGGFLLFGRNQVAPEPREEAAVEARAAVQAPEPAPAQSAAPLPIRSPTPLATIDSATAGDGELPPSHPITPERIRIQRQNQYIQSMNDAMDLEDAPALRDYVRRFRAEGFDDADHMADGYEIVANCIEHPGEASRAAAQSFWDRERSSILRRHVKRHCLE